jgi:prepilin-type N-terminal cleavage/methylation domain-containing protein
MIRYQKKEDSMNLKGFTLVELVVVIAMISVLALTSMVGYDRFIGRAQDAKAEEIITNLQTEIFATTSFSGVEVNVGTELVPELIRVVYNLNEDRIYFYKSQSAPTEEQSIQALEIVLSSLLDDQTWDVNPLSASSLETLSVFYDLDAFLNIDYASTFGGTYVWKPTYTRTTQ